MNEANMRSERMKVRFSKKGREWRFLDLLYVSGLALCHELKENLKVFKGHLVEVCKITGLNVNIDNTEVIALTGQAGSVWIESIWSTL